jgi:phage gp45-like
MLQHGDVILIVASDDRRYRLALEEGDAVLYSGTDNYVRCKGDGGIEVCSSGPVTVQAGDIRLGSETAAEVRALVDERIVTIFNAHTHALGSGVTLQPATLITAATPCTTTALKGK